MSPLEIIIAPNPIFRQKAQPVDKVDDTIRQIVDDMFAALYAAQGLGIGANMVGVLKRIIVIDLQEGGKSNPLACINPEIIWASEETAEFDEASLSFPGISAKITRPTKIRLSYLDRDGNAQDLEADAPLSTVIQHEMDYLDGRTYLDHLSKIKRDRLLKKMTKLLKAGHHHTHGHHHHHDHDCGDPDCGHDH